MVAREFATHYGRSENVSVVFNGVDVPQSDSGESRQQARARIRRQLGINESEPVFLTIATNFELKGVDFAIRSLAELRAKTGSGTLIAVGTDSPGRFGKLAESSGLGQAVHFVDRQAEIFPLVCSCGRGSIVELVRCVQQGRSGGVQAGHTVDNNGLQRRSRGARDRRGNRGVQPGRNLSRCKRNGGTGRSGKTSASQRNLPGGV